MCLCISISIFLSLNYCKKKLYYTQQNSIPAMLGQHPETSHLCHQGRPYVHTAHISTLGQGQSLTLLHCQVSYFWRLMAVWYFPKRQTGPSFPNCPNLGKGWVNNKWRQTDHKIYINKIGGKTVYYGKVENSWTKLADQGLADQISAGPEWVDQNFSWWELQLFGNQLHNVPAMRLRLLQIEDCHPLRPFSFRSHFV